MKEENPYLKQMGLKIKTIRKSKKLSLDRMGKLIGMDKSNLWFLEDGKRNTHILSLKNIADVLGVDVKDFI